MPSRCRQNPVPYRSVQACLVSEAEQRDVQDGLGNAATQDLLLGDDGNLAQHAIRPPDQGPFDKKIALTFDDGPDIETTPRILNILDDYGIKATFFVHGEEIDSDADRELLEHMRDRGHIVANHSERHENLRRHPQRAGPSIEATHERLSEVNEPHDPRFFRFPGGNAEAEGIRAAEEQGYAVVGWHGDSNDWCYNDRGPEGECDLVPERYDDDLVGNVLHEAERYDGGILLFHDNRAYTADQLPEILDALQAEGFTFTNLDDEETFPILAAWADTLTPQAEAPLGPYDPAWAQP